MKAFEDATGKPLEEDKKELASEELITTGDLGDDIGQDKATGIVNDVKTEIIKNNTKDTIQIAETINNVVNNYNVTLSDEQMAKLESLMGKISQQDYDYSEMKNALKGVSEVVNENLEAMGESVNNGFFNGIFDSIKDFFTGIGDWFKETFSSETTDSSSILENTNDSILGEDAQIDATDKSTINLPSSEEVEGFFAKIWNWFTGLFNNNSNEVEDNNNDNTTLQEEGLNNDNTNEDVNSLEENSTINENVQPDSSLDQDTLENTDASVEEQTIDTNSDNITDSIHTDDEQLN